jgi:hypothetical protein
MSAAVDNQGLDAIYIARVPKMQNSLFIPFFGERV